ncbi:putative tyrosinase central domain protein [Drepanopeziza brunnea f. sp. 'multigermtubi' MB_m1]|uniref:Putative tyrosinase central domain protein n=1 Tax=Marssonina brunnea f. sp. multigermtubi (strain MB_m1) TaxID=1072389 RepID=K1WVB6_MARBU|nr:putative tyrosinase central domain protein [Drepanopeziza brunnea f. sp. 'multigermtubi' MB_m1]EKD12593.1 putative tyrosinase central domain protein [Drepanopeziza brunnea f. sp. 'multigermtubi' MB_m1]
MRILFYRRKSTNSKLQMGTSRKSQEKPLILSQTKVHHYQSLVPPLLPRLILDCSSPFVCTSESDFPETSSVMRAAILFLAVALSLVGSGAYASRNRTLDALVAESSANIMAILEARLADASATCTSQNVVIRKEWQVTLLPRARDRLDADGNAKLNGWSAISSAEKLSYIAAIKCMQNSSAITPVSAVPGVRSRFDDFAALHINQTTTIHWTSVFYAWHRQYTWLYEKALREECGYTGYQPYWDWSSTSTHAAHPLFDGSETSISGNGKAVAHSSYVLIPTPTVINSTATSGTGGGCLTSGPFANFTINLGPFGAPVQDGFAYNPRCLTRDFRDGVLPASLSYDNVTLALSQDDLQSFTNQIEAGTALHNNGHTTTGGVQDDLWGSAQDPVFHFHHAQVDRVWTIWQGLNQTVRTLEIADTMTIKDCRLHCPPTLA